MSNETHVKMSPETIAIIREKMEQHRKNVHAIVQSAEEEKEEDL